MTAKHPCPKCKREMEHVVTPKEEITSSGDKLIMPLDSDVFRCVEHGMWRFYISGAVKPYHSTGKGRRPSTDRRRLQAC